jgi:threonine synthase
MDGSERVDQWNMRENTVASGLDDELRGYTQDGDRTLLHIRFSNGFCATLSEDEIIDSTLALGAQGIYSEPAGASGIAAAAKLRKSGVIGSGKTVVAIATGNGLKNPIKAPREPVIIDGIDELYKMTYEGGNSSCV